MAVHADDGQCPAVSILLLPMDLNPLTIQKIRKTALGSLRQIGFVSASSLDLGRIDVQDTDGFAMRAADAERVAVPYPKIGRLALQGTQNDGNNNMTAHRAGALGSTLWALIPVRLIRIDARFGS